MERRVRPLMRSRVDFSVMSIVFEAITGQVWEVGAGRGIRTLATKRGHRLSGMDNSRPAPYQASLQVSLNLGYPGVQVTGKHSFLSLFLMITLYVPATFSPNPWIRFRGHDDSHRVGGQTPFFMDHLIRRHQSPRQSNYFTF
jgi:hypothetical protein